LFAAISCSPALFNVSTSKDISSGLLTDKDVLVLGAGDAVSNGQVVDGSGQKLASKVYSNLKTRRCEAMLDNVHKSIDAVAESELQKYDYVIVPSISYWEDNLTAWSGKPDKITFSLEIFDKNKNKVNTATVDAKSSTVTMSANDPADLIDKPVIEFFNKVF